MEQMDLIEGVEDQNKLIIQNSIKYLYNLTLEKQLNVPTLKSLYRTKCRLMELRRQIFIPQRKPHQRCQRCFMNFSEGNTKYEVRAAKLSRFARKIAAKAKENGVLTSYQRLYYKKLQKKFPNGFHDQNKMILTCNFCEKETEIWMNKPAKKKSLSKNDAESARKKKKTKKRDKFCGLNENAVAQSAFKKKKTANNMETPATPKNTETHHNMNASVSMASTRIFETSEFIPLNAKQKPSIKLSKKGVKTAPLKPIINKSKAKLQQKNLNNLSSMLKKATDKKDKPSSRLKEFLDSL